MRRDMRIRRGQSAPDERRRRRDEVFRLGRRKYHRRVRGLGGERADLEEELRLYWRAAAGDDQRGRWGGDAVPPSGRVGDEAGDGRRRDCGDRAVEHAVRDDAAVHADLRWREFLPTPDTEQSVEEEVYELRP